MRGLSAHKQKLWERFWNYVFWEPVHFVMKRKMMLTIKQLVEQQNLFPSGR